MKIVHRIEYEVIGRFTCKEIVQKLEDAGGNVMCQPFGAPYFAEDLDDDVHMIFTSWAWIQDQRGNRKLYLFDFPKETRDIEMS